MVQMRIQRGGQGRASADQSHPCMTPAMDAPGVAFGLTKPPFQVQIVARQVIERTDKQARQKAGHQSRHVLGERVVLPGESAAEFLKLTATLLGQDLRRIECIGNGLDLLDLWSQFLLNLHDGLQPAVNAGR
jgi:hypothetical protein